MKKRNVPFVVLIVALFVAILVVYSRNLAQQSTAGLVAAQQQVEQPSDAPQADIEHEADDAHGEAEHAADEAAHEHGHGPGEHLAGHHDVPEEAAAVENPVSVSDKSVAAGEKIYAENCAVCHGENGKGDGPAAASLDKQPANLHEGHVQGLSDGALFWIISHGRPDTPMPPWDNVLSETERWQVVNFLRTFSEGEMLAQHQDAEHEHAADETQAHGEMSNPVRAHLQMAMLALTSDRTADAKHHLQHAVEIANADQGALIQSALDHLDSGETDAAQHELEDDVLAEVHVPEEKTMETLHLELAFSAIEAQDIENARHHMEHFVDGATGVDKLKGQQVLKLLDEQELHDAGHGVEGLLGVTPHGEH